MWNVFRWRWRWRWWWWNVEWTILLLRWLLRWLDVSFSCCFCCCWRFWWWFRGFSWLILSLGTGWMFIHGWWWRMFPFRRFCLEELPFRPPEVWHGCRMSFHFQGGSHVLIVWQTYGFRVQAYGSRMKGVWKSCWIVLKRMKVVWVSSHAPQHDWTRLNTIFIRLNTIFIRLNTTAIRPSYDLHTTEHDFSARLKSCYKFLHCKNL